MKVLGKKSISSIVKFTLQTIFVLGLSIIIFLPVALKFYVDVFNIDADQFFYPMLIILYISGAISLYIICNFIGLFGTLKRNTPFIMDNVIKLKKISISCLTISIIYFIGIFIFKTIFTAVIFMTFTIAWVVFLILAELFKQAVQYKEENDLTI